ncbi:MAG: carboxypeptidase M32 [Hydrogenibacillus schlegelii]|nr:carboxypeptidase M32 [Hydrogenibacillus schlegelii]
MRRDEALLTVFETVERLRHYHAAAGLMGWDMQTMLPPGGVEARAETMGFFGAESQRLLTEPTFVAALERLEAEGDALSPEERRMVTVLLRDVRRLQKIPPERYRAFHVLAAKGESIWREARAENDFGAFLPVLRELIQLVREFIDYLEPAGHPYDALLEQYEPGLTVERVDALFRPLREALPRLMALAASGETPDRSFLKGRFPKEAQRALSLRLSEAIGFDYRRGRLDESAHPFTMGIEPTDVRITTRYFEDDPFSSLFSTLHEAGHGIYEQNLPTSLARYGLMAAASMSIHESQSRFYENVVGRSLAFWRYAAPIVAEQFPALAGVEPERLFRAVNVVTPSFIRVEADEVTYNLHIVLRYELEKALFAGELEAEDLPAAWNAKMEELLGLTPPDDARGVLQDVHWSSGLFGYFPSYALGNLYAAMFAEALLRDLPDFHDRIERGDFAPIRAWMTEHVHAHGNRYDPLELLKRATGREPDPAPLLRYLEDKVRAVYRL